jgi:hypothetical protein
VPRFVELNHPADGRASLFAEDQVPRAGAAGFTEPLNEVDAPTRAAARCTLDARKTGYPMPYSPEVDGDFGLEPLPSRELAAVVAFVQALANRDDPSLEAAGAFAAGADPYLWTHDYGARAHVDLEVPPGAPEHWSGHVLRVDETRTAVVVDLWTVQEGPSDLSLAVDVDTSDGAPRIAFRDLHVL